MEEKLPQFDTKAGRQIFDQEYTAREPVRWATIPRDTENPVDVRLRQLAIEKPHGGFDLKGEFYDKWAVIMVGNIHNLEMIKGRIKDVFTHTRDIYIKTRKGQVYIVNFGKVMQISEREPA